MSCYSNCKNASIARKRRSARLLKKAKYLGDTKLERKAVHTRDSANKDYYLRAS